jgi:hypothetical protein
MRLRFVPVAVVAISIFASTLSVRAAISDGIYVSLDRQLFEVERERYLTGGDVDERVWRALAVDARRAVQLEPLGGYHWQMLGRVSSLPRVRDGAHIPPDVDSAYEAYRNMVVTQPSSSYAWAGLARAADDLLVQNRLEGGVGNLESSLVNAMKFGPRELPVALTVVDLGLANWQTISPKAKSEVSVAVRNLAGGHSAELLRVADRRGRRSDVCSMLAAPTVAGCKMTSGGSGG